MEAVEEAEGAREWLVAEAHVLRLDGRHRLAARQHRLARREVSRDRRVAALDQAPARGRAPAPDRVQARGQAVGRMSTARRQG